MELILAGDIGGTKVNLAIFDYNKSNEVRSCIIVQKTYQSVNYDSIEQITREFLEEVNYSVKKVVLAVAGPVIEGKSRITNLPWIIDEKKIHKKIEVDYVKLINDLEATAFFAPHLKSSEIVTINKGEPVSLANIAILAPGTGLGEAFLTWDGKQYRAYATEGGHTNFAPSNDLEVAILKYLQKKYEGHVSIERICSGIGISNIYDFLIDSGYATEPKWLTKKLEGIEDVVPIIIQVALNKPGKSILCDKVLDIFITILGNETANFALKTMALGGIYLGGGIPPKIIPAIQSDKFLESFYRKGRMFELVSRMPINIILNRDTALLGTALYAFSSFNSKIT
ncbi:MAG: glucokinase [Candidatus Hodarchaeales archaeon]|jgi:glucokinase